MAIPWLEEVRVSELSLRIMLMLWEHCCGWARKCFWISQKHFGFTDTKFASATFPRKHYKQVSETFPGWARSFECETQVKAKKCTSKENGCRISKLVLKPYDSYSNRQSWKLHTIFWAASAIRIACKNHKQKLYCVNNGLDGAYTVAGSLITRNILCKTKL